MSRIALKNILIALQLLILCALTVLILMQNQHRQQAQQARTLMAEHEAQHIVIERQNERLVFSRSSSGWDMTEPLEQAASAQRITALLSLLTLPRSHRYSIRDLDADELGLVPAQASVQINQLRFEFGHTDVSGQKRYLKLADSVYLIDDLIFPLINGAVSTFTSPAATE